MAISTIYDIRVRLLMNDRGTKAVTRVVRQFGQMRRDMGAIERQQRSIGFGFGRLAAMAGGAFGIKQAWDATIGFNSSLEQARLNVAGMLSQATGEGLTSTLGKANALVGKLQMRARDSIGTTQEMVEMAALITRPISAAGLGMKDLEDFTASAVVAAKAFGIQADVAARDIEGALMGQLRSVDRFSRALLESKAFGGKYIGEEGRARFNAMSGAERASEYRKALTGGGIGQLAKAQSKTFAGVFSTLKDNLEITLGKIGLPLFQAITKEIGTWNKWIDKNQVKIKQFARDFAGTLMSGFRLAKAAGAFIIKHKDLLLTLAKAWLAGKVVKGIAQASVSVANVFKNLGAMDLSLGGLAAKASVAANALGLIAAAAVAFASWVDSRQTADIKRKTKMTGVGAYADWAAKGQISEAALYKEYKRLGLVDKDGKFKSVGKGGSSALRWGMDAAWAKGKSYMERSGPGARRGYVVNEGEANARVLTPDELNAMLQRGMHAVNSELLAGRQFRADLAGRAMVGPKPGEAGGPGTKWDKEINVKIQNVEVAADDPDRFVLEMANLAEDAIKSPSVARGSIRY